MNKDMFIKKVQELGITLKEEQLNQLEIYCNYLIEYNEHTNLTSITDKEQIYLKHFYDSITFCQSIDLKEYNNLIDIGTGAGFPGMILKILYPNLKVTLLDSNNKKITFLQELSKKLNINDIEFYHGRAEEYVIKNREKFDIVTARAVSNLTILSELCIPLTKVDGYFIPMKGSNTEEIKEAEYAIEVLGAKIEKIYSFNLPEEESGRNIVKIKKIKETPKEYPRRYDKITKSPLKKNRK